MKNELKEKITAVCGAEHTLFDEPLSRHTSFRIGGPADVFVLPGSEEELQSVLSMCEEANSAYTVIGNGTNILADDEGYRGVIICIGKNFASCERTQEGVQCGAGLLLSSLSAFCTENALTGMEFASGIPGSVGGAVFMNAGAYGGEIKDVIVSARVLKPKKGIITVAKEDLKLGYRTSMIEGSDMVVTGALFRFENGDPEKIRERIAGLKEQRTAKQPLEYPSAGSTFKRPKDLFAGKLIMDAGLKGFSIGGAQVSEKHCGFIINTGSATSKDVKELMAYVVKTVEDRFGITLEREVRFL